MSIRQRIGAAWRAFLSDFGPTGTAVRQATASKSADIPANDHRWRRVGESRRDLTTYTQDKAIDVAYALMRENPIAGSITECLDEWTVGDGMSVVSTVKDPEGRAAHQAVIDAVLKDAQVKWDEFQHEIPQNLGPVGEVLVLVFPPPGGRGDTGLGVVDPKEIQQVLVNPQNARQTMGAILKPPSGTGRPILCMSVEYREWMARLPVGAKVPLRDVPPVTEGAEYALPSATGAQAVLVGPDCYYFHSKRLLGATRGRSDFFAYADDLDAYAGACWQMQEGVAARNAIAGVLKHNTSQQEEAQKLVDRLNSGSGRGGIFHAISGTMELNLHAPSMGTYEFQRYHATQIARIAAATRIPPTFFGEATDTGNAATTELAGPALKAFKKYQALVRSVITTLLGYQMRSKCLEAGIPEENWQRFDVILPDVGGRESLRAASAMGQIGNFIDLGTSLKAWTPEKAGAMLRRQATELLDESFEEEDIPSAEEMAPAAAPALPAGAGDGGEPTPEEAAKLAEELKAMRAGGSQAA